MQGGFPRGMGMGFRGPNMGSFPMGQNPAMQMTQPGFMGHPNVRPQPMISQQMNPMNTGNLVAYPSTRIVNAGQMSVSHGGGGQWGNVGNNLGGARPQTGGVVGYGAGRLPQHGPSDTGRRRQAG